ncbi:protein kinase domain-containing protein [Tahibacter harae]|uniref:Serine/threonine-protein kinase n=1 Tax=Tahibacter harae TaxID=2963937 RepID=A0ABT1QNS8_9GAMM|nr:serine/threonine-protein kinase [Tahibacter harae]
MPSADNWPQVEALFDAAWELPAPQRRDWVLAQEAAAAVREAVLRLLDAAEHSDGFLGTVDPAAGAAVPETPLPAGERAGAWRIVRPLGQGGMGDVYEVERADGHFAQRAALKRIAPARNPDAVRFHIERATLARLEHPGIARLIDGGLLGDGRPFMVMELVEGLPADIWCEQQHADAAARVQLLLQVCDALAYAHGKLVVHRDLKPSNILVDAHGRARLIDFGVAYLADEAAPAQDRAPLSPAYAAPEQIAGAPVTTATDVYGAAAVLYHLLAGRPLRQSAGLPGLAAALDALDTPPARLAGLSAHSPCNSAGRALHTDLAAILARALAVDPVARYPTVEALRDDLQRALQRGIVAARRDEPGHRLYRTLWRLKWPVAAAAAVAASLVLGLGLALRYASQAAHERDQARIEQARLEAVQQSVFHMFRSAGEMKGGSATASDVLESAARRIGEEFARDPAQAAPVLHALGELYFLITDYEAAQPLLQRLAGADPGVVDPALIAAARYDLAQVLYRRGDAEGARPLLAQAQQFWSIDPARWESRTVDSRLLQAQLLRSAGEHAAAAGLLQAALARRVELSGPHHRETGVFHNNLGVARFASGQTEAARTSFRAAREVWQAAGLAQSPDALNTLNNWGSLELAAGDPAAAEPLLREAVALRRRFYGPSAATAALLNNYGKLLLQQSRASAALPVLQDAAAMGAQFAGHGSLHHVAALAAAAEAQLDLGHREAGASDAAIALEAALATLGPDHIGTALASLAMARLRLEQQQPRAAAVLLDTVERIAAAAGPSGARLLSQAAALRARLPAPAVRPAPDKATPAP